MARISDEVINQIKQSISLQRLVESRGSRACQTQAIPP